MNERKQKEWMEYGCVKSTIIVKTGFFEGLFYTLLGISLYIFRRNPFVV